MIDSAREEVARQSTSVLQWICADALEVARFLSQPVDYVLMANTFHGVLDQPGLLSAINAVLRPKGKFGLVNWHQLPREATTMLGKPRGPATQMRMSPDQTSAVLEAAGFRIELAVELPPYHYALVCQWSG